MPGQGRGEALPSLGVVRLQSQGTAERRLRLLRKFQIQQGDAEVVGNLGAEMTLAQGCVDPRVIVKAEVDGPLQNRHRLLIVAKIHQNLTEADIGEGVVRLTLKGRAESPHRLMRLILNQRAAEARPGPRRIRVGVHDMTEQGHLIMKDPRLLHGENTADRQHQRRHRKATEPHRCYGVIATDYRGGRLILQRDRFIIRLGNDIRQPPISGHGGGRQHRDQADSGKILIAVGDERELHITVVGEAEHGGEGDDEEQHSGQRPPPDSMSCQP